MLSQLRTIRLCALSEHARQFHFCSRTHVPQPVLSAGNCNGGVAPSSTRCQTAASLATQNFLKPSTTLLTQTAGIKHVGKLSLRCRHCYYMVKDEQQYVMCTAKPRHYQAKKMPGKKCVFYLKLKFILNCELQGWNVDFDTRYAGWI